MDSGKFQAIDKPLNNNGGENNQEFKEKRKSHGQNRGNETKNQSYRNNSGQNNFSRKQSGNQNVSRSTMNGESNSFIDRLKEEEDTLRVKYNNVPKTKESLCFTFIKGDLFSAPLDASLAHCVSEDFRMGKGIATEFKKRFEGINELLTQSKKRIIFIKKGFICI